MITNNVHSQRLVGLKDDTKPLDVPNGTVLEIIDEENVKYIFDEDSKQWYPYTGTAIVF